MPRSRRRRGRRAGRVRSAGRRARAHDAAARRISGAGEQFRCGLHAVDSGRRDPIDGKWLPDADLEYFVTQYISTELLLTVPQSQTVTDRQSALGGPTAIGSFRHLPRS
jgi:outer membrane protein W